VRGGGGCGVVVEGVRKVSNGVVGRGCGVFIVILLVGVGWGTGAGKVPPPNFFLDPLCRAYLPPGPPNS